MRPMSIHDYKLSTEFFLLCLIEQIRDRKRVRMFVPVVGCYCWVLPQ